jgi:diaminohydroxyphosphoribosylaminopyrimidine deaminase/5-amino-6-(5-phosphoribosylamino)uracil reductase
MLGHESYMQRSFQLARLASGYTAPNPLVGAVLVHEGRILAEGYHPAYGQRHAEAVCFDNLREEDRHLLAQSTLYVSLEPCAHWGKQPPCADRIVSEKVGRVVVSNRDPFSQVAGRGFEKLHEAGIPVELGILEQEGRWLNRRFFTFHEKQRPYIILKWAQSVDGYIAPDTRARTQLTGPLSSRLVHRWRTEEASILVGKTTAEMDNPQLTARHWSGPQPLRIVLDRQLQLPRNLKVFDNTADTWHVSTKQGQPQLPGHITVPSGTEELPALLRNLYEAGKLSLIVEGGAAVLNSFIIAGLWDEARVLTAPVTLAGGISAPLLLDAQLASESFIGPDQLTVFTQSESGFSYPAGAPL